MTNLEQFLNKEKKENITSMEPASGSFSCQNVECKEVIFEGYVDRSSNRIHWKCSQGHESSVVI
jgi:hypothetical protein